MLDCVVLKLFERGTSVSRQFLINFCIFRGLGIHIGMKYPLTDYGTPEEEAWRWKFVPWYIRMQRIRDTYPFTVKYYAKPEGEDLLGKVIAINRNVLPYGFVSGITHACMHSNAVGIQATTGRVFHMMWPVTGAATAFATVSYFGCKIRGQDDLYVLKMISTD